LIKEYPQSRWVQYAYFGFGDLFAHEAKDDPQRWPMAEQAYKRASDSADAPLAAESLLRLSEVYRAMGDPDKANATLRQRNARYPNGAASGSVP
jgi:TolA-binding protein